MQTGSQEVARMKPPPENKELQGLWNPYRGNGKCGLWRGFLLQASFLVPHADLTQDFRTNKISKELSQCNLSGVALVSPTWPVHGGSPFYLWLSTWPYCTCLRCKVSPGIAVSPPHTPQLPGGNLTLCWRHNELHISAPSPEAQKVVKHTCFLTVPEYTCKFF